MKNLKFFSFLFLLMGFCSTGFSQNGNAVISEINVYDLGDGTGMIVVRISGNLADYYSGGLFTISGDRFPGGSVSGGMGNESRVFIQPPVPGNGNSNGNEPVIIAGMFPLEPAHGGNQSDDVNIELRLRRIGNGLDYTYSRVGRIRRPTGI